MAPKKGPKTPVRRSARIQSRESSVASEDAARRGGVTKRRAAEKGRRVKDAIAAILRGASYDFIRKLTPLCRKEVIVGITEQNHDLQERVDTLESDVTRLTRERDEAVARKASLRRDFALAEIYSNYAKEQQKQEEQPAAVPTRPAPATEIPAPTPPSPPAAAPALTPASSAGWRKMITSFGGYIASPFIRKRAADDEEPLPSQKRARVEPQPQTISTSPQSPPEQQEVPQRDTAVVSPPRFQIIEQQNPTEELDAQTTPKPAPSPRNLKRKQPAQREEISNTPKFTSRVTPKATPNLTPESSRQRNSFRDYGVPSSKNPRIPTSLSTITENSEPSFLNDASESLLGSTPSKPPRAQPQRTNNSNNTLQVPQSTPAADMRRYAQLKAAKSASRNKTPSRAWDKPPARPKERNADVRLQKLQRMEALQQELKQLQEDEDIIDFTAHRRKRVKVDNLVSIPHNRPGESSGTFRVPDVDSDDEMEVYDDVEERANIFEEMNKIAQVTAAREEATPIQQTLPAPTQAAPVVYNFPDVGGVPEVYYVSNEYKAEACRLFEEGFMEYLSTGAV